MPEGDTVWRSAHHLHEALAGHTLTSTEFRVPRFATVELAGETVREVVPRGKHLLVRTDQHSIHSHLKMEGSWHLYLPETMQRGKLRRPAHTIRAILRTEAWVAVGFDLGIVEVLPRDREDRAVGHLGPDVLDPDFDRDLALAQLTSEPDLSVFVALLDQRKVAGFGNEYANELCFLARLDPRTPVRDADMGAILDRGVRLITANRDRTERTFTGVTRRGQMTWVFGREGQPCRRCQTRVREISLGRIPTQERRTYFCPTCQPLPGSDGPAR